MEGTVGLGEIWCHKEKEFAVYYGCWAGGSEIGSGRREPQPPPHPPPPGTVDGQRSFLVWGYVGSRIILHCSPAFKGPLVRNLWSWGALFSPLHLPRSWQEGFWNPCRVKGMGSLHLDTKGD